MVHRADGQRMRALVVLTVLGLALCAGSARAEIPNAVGDLGTLGDAQTLVVASVRSRDGFPDCLIAASVAAVEPCPQERRRGPSGEEAVCPRKARSSVLPFHPLNASNLGLGR